MCVQYHSTRQRLCTANKVSVSAQKVFCYKSLARLGTSHKRSNACINVLLAGMQNMLHCCGMDGMAASHFMQTLQPLFCKDKTVSHRQCYRHIKQSQSQLICHMPGMLVSEPQKLPNLALPAAEPFNNQCRVLYPAHSWPVHCLLISKNGYLALPYMSSL